MTDLEKGIVADVIRRELIREGVRKEHAERIGEKVAEVVGRLNG